MSATVTGEAVRLELRRAALPSRVVAALIDVLAQGTLALVLVTLAALGGSRSGAADAAIGILLLVAVLIAYPVAFETALRGRTPGKAAMGLRVVRDDGGPIGFRQALVRGLAGAFVERPGVTLFLGGVLTSLLNAQGKRLGDLLAGTVVLQERVPGAVSGAAPPQVPPALEAWAATLDLSGLPADLAASARSFTDRAPTLTAAAREQLGGTLVRAVVDRVTPPPPPGTPGWAVLAAVLGERHRRAGQATVAPSPAPVAQAPVAQAPVAQAPVAQAPVAQAPVTQAPVAEPAASRGPADGFAPPG